jgi:hypothetical protein
MASSMLDEDQIPVDVTVDDSMIRVRFSGGLELATPVNRFPRLRDAEPSKRHRWELVGRGYGIHWPDVDEDISVRGLFSNVRKVPESAIEQIPVLISDLLKTTGRLNALFAGRPFTPDGHLVGSIGEVVAEYIYDLILEPCSTPQIDAYTKEENRRSVQVKLTGENGSKFGFRWPVPKSIEPPDLLVCLRMTREGFTEVYNGSFPLVLLREKSLTSNGQVSIAASALAGMNPVELRHVRSFDSINRWFKSTPELADVA